ncbi:unnamed protein product [Nesidiocoris tenuis]|uniref:Uncharacterized protein n=1 Tax=Nesidiocoris tenuis TaxID=355587 RepID=A0A6H5HB10_9HEMI|nr:unnamed protein product [Nesidiocoris tenuis]
MSSGALAYFRQRSIALRERRLICTAARRPPKSSFRKENAAVSSYLLVKPTFIHFHSRSKRPYPWTVKTSVLGSSTRPNNCRSNRPEFLIVRLGLTFSIPYVADVSGEPLPRAERAVIAETLFIGGAMPLDEPCAYREPRGSTMSDFASFNIDKLYLVIRNRLDQQFRSCRGTLERGVGIKRIILKKATSSNSYIPIIGTVGVVRLVVLCHL